MTMTGQKAAEILFNCATILEMHGANEFRVNAYRNAARIMIQLGDDAKKVALDDALLQKAGFGKSLSHKLRELFSTGQLGFYEGLLASLPADVARLMKMPGVGPKIATRLNRELGVRTPRELAAAAGAGEVSKLHGFGPKREAMWAAVRPGSGKEPTPIRSRRPAPIQPALIDNSDTDLAEAA